MATEIQTLEPAKKPEDVIRDPYVELFMEHQDELDQIMEVVKQSFDAQAE